MTFFLGKKFSLAKNFPVEVYFIFDVFLQFHREQLQSQLEKQSFEEQKRKLILESGKREQELLQIIQNNEEKAGLCCVFFASRNSICGQS